MPFFLKSREKAVSQSQPGLFRFPCPAHSSKSHNPPNDSSSIARRILILSVRRRGVELTIASALPETGGVTHCELCVLAVAAD
jgi:hypothetical protein